MALELNGTDQYIHIPDDNSLDLVNNGTIDALIYLTAYAAPGQSIIFKRNVSGTNYQFFIGGTGGGARARKLAYYDGTVAPNSVADIPLNQWTRVGITINDQTKEAKFYINGALDSTGTGGLGTNLDTYLDIGTGVQLGDPSPYAFNGIVGPVRIYNRTLSASEMQTLNNANNITDGLVGKWLMNEKKDGDTAGGVNGIIDISPEGNHGTAEGNPIYRAAPIKLFKPMGII